MESNIDKTPNHILGVEIVEALISKGLLTKADAKEFRKKIITGTLKESDWKVGLESALNKKDGK